MPTRISPFMLVCGLALLVMVGLVLSAMNRNTSASPSLGRMQGRCVEMGYGAREYMKPLLKSPGSARFGRPESHYSDAGQTCISTSYVDSQNGFGALLRTHFRVTLSPRDTAGEHWTLVDLKTW